MIMVVFSNFPLVVHNSTGKTSLRKYTRYRCCTVPGTSMALIMTILQSPESAADLKKNNLNPNPDVMCRMTRHASMDQ